MNFRAGIFFFFFCSTFFLSSLSAATSKKYGPALVPVENQTLYVKPIRDYSELNLSSQWPADSIKSIVLKKQLQPIYSIMVAELRRSSKTGKYSVVEDSTLPAAINIQITIKKHQLKADTLSMPVSVEIISNRSGGTSQIFNFEARGIIRGITKPKSTFHQLGILLADYRRNFPYNQIVSLFCPQPLK